MQNNDLVDMIVDHRIFLSFSLSPMHCNSNDASSAVSQSANQNVCQLNSHAQTMQNQYLIKLL